VLKSLFLLTCNLTSCSCDLWLAQEARKASPVQQGRQYRAHAKSSSSDSSQSPPRQRARQ